MTRKQLQPIAEYVNDCGQVVFVYPEKKVKRKAWMRGEAFYGQKMRIDEGDDRLFVRFKRKNGKY